MTTALKCDACNHVIAPLVAHVVMPKPAPYNEAFHYHIKCWVTRNIDSPDLKGVIK